MEQTMLSLKTIYMLLMTEDFPIYSESVIGRNERKGSTMLRFWQGQIAGILRAMERYEEALEVYKELLENVQKLGDANLMRSFD